MMITTTLLLLTAATHTGHEHGLIDWNCGRYDPRPDPASLPFRPAPSTHLGSNQNFASGQVGANRVDIVFLGDGYTQPELGTYANRVNVLSAALMDSAPYNNYQNYFNIHRVDVVSNESGVDNDPIGVFRDTALNMAFSSSAGNNLLHIDLGQAAAYAQNAPDVDTIIALANSSKYGGTGFYASSVSTAPAHSASSPEIVKHEFGHGFGQLADEYFAAGTTYPGGEQSRANISVQTAEEMLTSGSKWASWFDFDSPSTNGPVGVYEGAYHYQFGMNRPSPNSLMRSLGKPFNAPSREAVILEIYKLVQPIDDSSDPNLIHDETATLFVTPMQPMNYDLDVSWSLDGALLPGVDSNELPLCSLGLAPGWHAVQVSVVDNSPQVRNEIARAQFMTQTLLFPIFSNGTNAAEIYCTAAPNSAGPGASIGFNGSSSLQANDLELTVSGAVPGTPGLFLSGTSVLELPFGDGYRCAGGSLVRFAAQVVDAQGSATRPVDFTHFPNGLSLQAGDPRSFQFWFRDPTGPGGSGFNLSNGLNLRLCP